MRSPTRTLQAIAALALAACSLGALASAPANTRKASDYSLAESALLQGRAEDAVVRLQAMIAANPKDAPARLLLCRAFFSEELIDDAVTACEGAQEQAPNNSQIEDWLGRAYGRKADRSGPIAGFQLARKVRAAFEAAVQHDPHSGSAFNDLSEYYVEAPALVGGGLDKADALANRVASDMPQQAHRTRALAAEKRKDYDTAEREFRSAVQVALRPEAWADLGAYYQRRRLDNQAVDALEHCLAADRVHGPAIVDAASVLYEMHREPRLAELTLRLYLDGNAKTDDAPVFKVHVLLSRMRVDAGDKAGAKIELDAALLLAPNYAPARNGLKQLS